MSNPYKKIVIIGATSAIAEHCARIWVKESSVNLVLVGRNIEKTDRVANDLRIRSPQSVITTQQANFTDPDSIRLLVDHIAAEGAIDTVLIAHGSLPAQSECQNDLKATYDALTINATSPALFAEAFAGHMQQANKGTLAIIGSVAGDRGRKSNYVYGAAKGLITRFAQGLQHRLANTGVKVVLIKPGPTATPMTAHLQESNGSMAQVDDVAQRIVQGINQGKSVIYAPAKWALIMMIIRHLPGFVFNKMDI
jgi:short-subunit dehydrogenase